MLMLLSMIPMSAFAAYSESEAITKLDKKVLADDVVLKISTSKSKYKTNEPILIMVELYEL